MLYRISPAKLFATKTTKVAVLGGYYGNAHPHPRNQRLFTLHFVSINIRSL